MIMKATLLNGCIDNHSFGQGLQDAVLAGLQNLGASASVYVLRELNIAPCTGCFGCWIKTPGVCVIPDVALDIARDMVQNPLLVMITPVTFGGYSWQLKKALDRVISIISPFFKIINGEIHHQSRYLRYPHILVLGYMPAAIPGQVQTFQTLVKRNCINLHAEKNDCLVFLESENGQTVAEKIALSLAALGSVS